MSGLVRCVACGNEYETNEPCGKRAMAFRDKPEHFPAAFYETDICELFERVFDDLNARKTLRKSVAESIERHMREIMKENADPKDDK